MGEQRGDVEVRGREYGEARIEIREDGDEAKGIAGLGIPVGVKADIGSFTEEISSGAVRDAMDQGWDVVGLFNHDVNYPLGRTSSGTMTLAANRKGLNYEIPDMPESRSDVMEAIKRGDVQGNSFSFTVSKEEWDESEDLEKPHRTIKRFGRLFDVGPVTFPAYEGLTTVSARALDKVRELAEERTKEEKEPVVPVAVRRRQLALAEAQLVAHDSGDAA